MATLKSWKLPPSEFTATKPVTLRGLLSHTAGLTVHGFPGYDVDSTVPTLVQVLDGTAPANTQPIRSNAVPGERWTYSGGGYTIMQQMLIDATGERFPELMRKTVLAPLGMERSSYGQPLRGAMAGETAAGHYPWGEGVRGRSHLYPEMAAAGLWTTPSDLVMFATEIQRAYTGQSSKVINQATARRMLADEKDGHGLGVFLWGSGPSFWFAHNGRDEGFDASLAAAGETGQAVAIMINANDDSRMMDRIRGFIARKYRWPNASAYVAPAAVSVSASELSAVTGRYEMANNQMETFVAQNGRLFTSYGGGVDEEYIPLGNDRFASTDRDERLTFVRDASNVVTSLTVARGTSSRTVPRIGPLFGALVQQPDDVALTNRVTTVLRALAAGGDMLKSAQGLTEGARRDFGRGAWRPATGLRSLVFVSSEDVASRNIERHDGKVARILYYRMLTERGERQLLVHLTIDGLVTDVDTVDD